VFPDTSGRLTALGRGKLVLGRGEDCSVALPGHETSRHHGEIRCAGPIHVLRDLGSRNGVFLNGRRIDEAPLSTGDVLRLGEWIGLVVRADTSERAPVFEHFAPGLYGGPGLRSAIELARRAAPSELPVLLEGETGCGKERIARIVHGASGRNGAFLALNCAAVPEAIAEAELFGYRKGAFTGAERGSPGHLRAAHEGTLLLDEIGDLSAPLQAKLLRAIEQREVLPLGESTPVRVDVRVIAACQAPLRQAVAEGRFRGDLYARLDGVTIALTPLRERNEEIVYVFSELLKEHSGGAPPAVEPRLIESLCLYGWPFNVRELDLLVRRLLVLHGTEPMLKRSSLPARMVETDAPPVEDRDERDLALLSAALRRHRGNVARAAQEANISRQRAYRLMGGRKDLNLTELRGTTPPGSSQDPSE
jgi:DNA-binding NtrC family response regulator